MSRPRTGEKEKALIESAIHLFLEQGVKGTTIKQIAKQANVAVGTVYVYFRDKPEIVRRVAYAFAEHHHEFTQSILQSRRKPLEKLNAYLLGFYDMWQPFGKNTQGSVELAEAVLQHAPETPALAEAEFLSTIERILNEARDGGMSIERPKEEARWIVLSTLAFFPLAGTPNIRPVSGPLKRKDLEGLLHWIGRKLT